MNPEFFAEKFELNDDFQVKSRIVYYDFDHKDVDSYNNSIENCQALCKNCHANKTERERGMDRN